MAPHGWYLVVLVCASWMVIVAGENMDNVTCAAPAGVDFLIAERRLLSCLGKDYDTAVRPVMNASQKLVVHVEIPSTIIHRLDSHKSSLEVTAWIFQSWKDIQLKWNPEDYNNVEEIRMPVSRIWNPQVTVYNAMDKVSVVNGEHATVRSDGTVVWQPHLSIATHCVLDLTYFPFDTQSCKFLIGTWAYTEDKVDIRVNGTSSMRRLVYGGHEWREHGMSVHHSNRALTEPQYPYLEYTLTMQRVSSFYSYMFVGPSAVLALASLCVFLIPPGRGERFIMCSGLLLCVFLLLALLADYVPTNLGTVPVVAVYLAFNLALLLVVEMLSILTLNFHNREGKRSQVPNWVRRVFLGRLSQLVCVRIPPYALVLNDLASEETTAERELGERFHNGDMARPSSPTLALERTLDDIRRYLRLLAARASAPPTTVPATHKEMVVNEWHQVALVIDRLMFALFLMITIIITLALYTSH